ncbi:hypothetical protein TELCIR_05802 [Teladorsagia circumcincta]|uniref:Uncharacterized protein n=1 Tax=Teladorsagia circumcincta TaxID=45464 RepID=A0A2G9UQ44_TELCI|nr:hypothetical protein TELCIR_05802 [Teladorsagia circumcincta]
MQLLLLDSDRTFDRILFGCGHLSWNGSDRLVVASKESPRKQFEIVPEPLSKAIGVHFAGQEGWNFCNSLPMYLLEESKNE